MSIQITDFSSEDYTNITDSLEAIGFLSRSFSNLLGVFDIFRRTNSIYTQLPDSVPTVRNTLRYVSKRITRENFYKLRSNTVPIPIGLSDPMYKLYPDLAKNSYLTATMADILDQLDKYIAVKVYGKEMVDEHGRIKSIRDECEKINRVVDDDIRSHFQMDSKVEISTVSNAYGNEKLLVSTIKNHFLLEKQDPTPDLSRVNGIIKAVDSKVDKLYKNAKKLDDRELIVIKGLLEATINAVENTAYYNTIVIDTVSAFYVGMKMISDQI